MTTTSAPPPKVPPAQKPTSVIRTRAAGRQLDALKLRMGGATFAQIAHAVGVSKKHAYRLVEQALEEHKEETLHKAEQLRILEIMRLDAMQAAVWKGALDMTGSMENRIAAQVQVLRIMERRARYLNVEVNSGSGGGVGGDSPRGTGDITPAAELLARFERIDRALNAPLPPPPPEPEPTK